MSSKSFELLWGKSNAGGVAHSLVGHLYDTYAVGELIWDRFMAPGFRGRLDDWCGGAGKEVFLLACTLHDVGKASPAFQSKDEQLAQKVRQGGLAIRSTADRDSRRWHHTQAGAKIIADLRGEWSWLCDLILGHHGAFPERPGRVFSQQHGDGPWLVAQRELVESLLEETGLSLDAARCGPPPAGVQLALSGFLVMADWISSSDEFPGDGFKQADLNGSRVRAGRAWTRLRLAPGWRPGRLEASERALTTRFSFAPRPTQRLAVETAMTMKRPGILVIEAPPGEGKTEAGFAVAEVLARKFGCNGFAFAMPTQGTTDAMYSRVTKWAESIDPQMPVSLLHGKAMLNEEWVEALEGAEVQDDCFGIDDDPYLPRPETRHFGSGPADWLRGRHRALLSPGVVGTYDQLLWAAARSKFVMLRHAGLAGKAVVIDEVHSFDVHMGQFLQELLRWLGDCGVPVVLMSATLAPDHRAQLLEAYSSGSAPAEPVDGYPVVTVAEPGGVARQFSTGAFRESREVQVEIAEHEDVASTGEVAGRVLSELEDGGCLLAVLNTVDRARAVYLELCAAGVDALLIHGRLTAAERSRRTALALDLLGPGTERRPKRFVVVATQIAEQSFDVDADLLVTDVAPMDLLIQRMGRAHRHIRPAGERPAALAKPRVVVVGVRLGGGLPEWPAEFDYIYGQRPERDQPTRSLALLASCRILATGRTWSISDDIPGLVADAYQRGWPAGAPWPAEGSQALEDLERGNGRRANEARTFLLGQMCNALASRSLTGLHAAPATSVPVVRDGDPTREVCLLIRVENGGLAMLDGTPLGTDGVRATTAGLARRVLGDTVRVPDYLDLGELTPPAAWRGYPLLEHSEVLVLGAEGHVRVPAGVVRYDPVLGLVIERGSR